MDIGDVLLDRGLLSLPELETLRATANGKRVDQVAVEQGLLTEEQALRALGDELGMRFVELNDFPIDRELLARFPTTAIFRHSLLPLRRNNGRVEIATADPFDLEALDELSSLSGFRLEPVLTRRDDLLRLIKEHLGVGGDTINELVAQRGDDVDADYLAEVARADSELAQMAQAASVIRLVNELLLEALAQQASDVHIEPSDKGLAVRYRVDGLLRLQAVPQEIHQFYRAIVTRLKIMARLNIAEKRLPQDGRIELRVAGREIDVRMSIIPMIHGEGVVLRILDKGRMTFNLSSMGMPDEIKVPFYKLINLPHGIVLVTGPTGSGKSTTLYSALNEIKDPTLKIITVEDPVEYQMAGINQIQVHAKIGLTFAAGLRSILRHDPDIILIGEIRDYETAESAIQSSLTGHLVFSTLHTNDAASAFTRLIDMGVEPYLCASTVEGVLAQRLVRRLCAKCKVPFHPTDSDVPDDFPRPLPEKLFKPGACRDCRETGYSGRVGIFELMTTNDSIRQLCIERASSTQIRHVALKHGLITLRQCGYGRVIEGITSVDEIARITKGDLN